MATEERRFAAQVSIGMLPHPTFAAIDARDWKQAALRGMTKAALDLPPMERRLLGGGAHGVTIEVHDDRGEWRVYAGRVEFRDRGAVAVSLTPCRA